MEFSKNAHHFEQVVIVVIGVLTRTRIRDEAPPTTGDKSGIPHALNQHCFRHTGKGWAQLVFDCIQDETMKVARTPRQDVHYHTNMHLLDFGYACLCFGIYT